MTEQFTLSVKHEALEALHKAKESFADRAYTTEELYAVAADMSNLAPHFIRWAVEDTV
jgi:hypothetical protein|tara:strand:+ start:401 stop:574 length:174 start_codon:yes stop_codon:yes gene_type:complete